VAVDQGVVRMAIRAAREAGADPLTFLAAGLVESGLRHDAIGDNGTSFGAFQWHRGGALGSHDPSWTRTYDAFLERARAFAAQGSGGRAAALAQRPADPHGYARKVEAAKSQARRLLQGLGMDASVEGNEEGVGGAGPDAGGRPSLVERVEQPGLPLDRLELLQGAIDRYSDFTGTRPLRLPQRAPRRVLELEEAPADELAAAGEEASAPAAPGRILGGKFSVGGGPGQGTHTLGNWQSDNAVDLMAPKGTPIYAVADGVIDERFGSLGGPSSRFGGARLTINGADGNRFYYAHLSRYAKGIEPGARVRRGDLIGYVGTANGVDHLHFGVERGDPRSYVQ
jgi:murein DD-endopeptidase MepM/ murein hydrolase activator NlpD